IDFRLTTSVTPPLAEMLDDRHLMEKYSYFLDRQIELGEKEVQRTLNDQEFHATACFYRDLFIQTKEFFDRVLHGNVLNGYRYFYDKGNLEVITCGATHGFLPLLSVNEKAVKVQIEVAVAAHKKHFYRAPRGIWLPECAYYDGLDRILKSNGIEFFIVDSHALVYGKPTALNGVYAPAYTPHSVAAFGRDAQSSKQVWSSKEGYPGDFNYRDFYRDIGYDLEFDYISPYINPDGARVFTGYKYHKITGTTDHKEPYDPYVALHKTQAHASDFHFHREKQLEHLSGLMDRTPMIVSPYDAELFGHWWFEGPEFLYNLFKEIDKHKVIKAITPIEYLNMYPTNQMVNPNPSSWGDKGYYDVWLNTTNAWIYRHLHEMADSMSEHANRYRDTNDFNTIRVLNQMLRELLLAQSSDWAFLMTTATATEYSINRTKEHIHNFNALVEMLDNNDIDLDALEYYEYKNSIFNFIDYKIFLD
ncbi:MAG: 1,4-alpha-glucan branching protein domain-containing protein, partial [Campylobacterota bacterium]|nr:1,4-alpha-glucan branching protein domain-containing protein [Campylobacterota bacterium]